MRNIVGNGNGRRKSKSEARAYRQSIKSNTTPLESTVDLRNNNLSGSAEANNIAFLDSSTQSAKISFCLRAKRFFKTHIFESVLGALMAFLKVGYHLLKNELMNLMPIILLVRFWNCN